MELDQEPIDIFVVDNDNKENKNSAYEKPLIVERKNLLRILNVNDLHALLGMGAVAQYNFVCRFYHLVDLLINYLVSFSTDFFILMRSKICVDI